LLHIPTKDRVASLFKVDFESTLRYVDIPVPDLPGGIGNVHLVGLVTERTETTSILRWLRDSKHVVGIYELRVRDSLFLPHNEEVISNCLKGLDVEVLDWMRVDMSIKPLLETCPHLKQLTVYAGGWAALSYWTSAECYTDLAKLPMVGLI
jgi:hypothetical protein